MDCCFPYLFDRCSFCNKFLVYQIYYFTIHGKGKHQNKFICIDCLTPKLIM